jgi:hypothetical protein
MSSSLPERREFNEKRSSQKERPVVATRSHADDVDICVIRVRLTFDNETLSGDPG